MPQKFFEPYEQTTWQHVLGISVQWKYLISNVTLIIDALVLFIAVPSFGRATQVIAVT